MKKYNFVCVQTIFNERMDTKKLRQKVLDLAIHGKLVPQNPNDEPASVLLERIRAEKERLIAEGKIKRSKKSATSDTSHYENVPEGWCITTIGEVFNLQAGKNISANDIHEFSQEFPYACYGGNGIRGYVSDYNKEGRFPIIGRQGALCGNVNFAEGKFYATEHAVVVTCIAGVNVEWARYVLEAMNLNQYATATAQPGLSVATVNEVEFLLPPLKEQCRIAEFVANCFDAIEALTSQTNNLRLNIDRAKSKILDLAIHGKLVPQDPNDEPASELLKRINPKAVASCDNPHYGNIPSSWVYTTMGSIFQHNTGKALNKSASTEGALLPYLTTSNVYWKTFDLSVVKEMRFKESEIEKCTIRKGDLLVCEGGDIGRAAIWDKDYSICIQNHLHRLRPKGDVVPLLYLYYIMYLKLSNNLEGKGIGLQGFSSGLLDKLEVPLPPYNEQIRIVDKIQEAFNMLDSIAESLN